MSFLNATITTTREPAPDGLGRTTGTATSVFSGAADVQEKRITAQTADGLVYDLGNAQAFPDGEPSAAWLSQEQGDTVAISWTGQGTSTAVISEAPRRLDGRMVLRYQDS